MTNNEYAELEKRLDVLDRRKNSIQGMLDELNEEMTKIIKLKNTKREYLFNFEGGGWNSVMALTIEDAKVTAKENPEWGSENLKVNFDTFRLSTPKDKENLLSLFH